MRAARLLPRLLLLLLLCVLGGLPATAQQRALQLTVGEGQLIRLERDSATVLLSDPEVADIQTPGARQIFVFARRPGRTSLLALDADGVQIAAWRVAVNRDAEEIQQLLRSELGNPTLAVAVTSRGAVLTGTVRTPQDAERARSIVSRSIGDGSGVVNNLTVTGALQVNLRVRVAEVSRDVTKNLGINVGALGASSGFAFGLLSGTGIAGAVQNSIANAIPNTAGQSGTLFARYNSPRANATALVDALVIENLATVLAEPTLVAVSGQPANFLAGGEFPVPIAQGFDRVSVDYRRFGVSLDFLPTVLNDDLIALRVRPEVSELTAAGSVTSNGFNIPGLRVRRAETTLELGSGQAFAIAGLLQNDTSTSIERFPLLGDIPVLGALFRSTRFRRNETELVIIVTPTIVRPAASAAALSDPTRRVAPPSDTERLLLGRIAARPGAEALFERLSRTRLRGDSGFVLE